MEDMVRPASAGLTDSAAAASGKVSGAGITGGSGDGIGGVCPAGARPAHAVRHPAAGQGVLADNRSPQCGDKIGQTVVHLGVGMSAVPRHLFVQEALRSQAYEDTPLPIGYGQTISQPYIVALMTQLLEVQRGMVRRLARIVILRLALEGKPYEVICMGRFLFLAASKRFFIPVEYHKSTLPA